MRGLLLGGSAVTQETATDHHCGQVGFEDQRTAERFHHDRGFHRARAEAAVVFRERQTQQALLCQLAPDLTAPAVLLCGILLALLKVIRVSQQPVDAVFQEALLLGQIKIHFTIPVLEAFA